MVTLPTTASRGIFGSCRTFATKSCGPGISGWHVEREDGRSYGTQRVPRPSPPASGQDRSPLRLMDRISRAKNRMRQSRSSGTVGGEGGNLLAYPANLIKLHKAQMASDRMSCHSATANQVRLVLHTAAYWLMLSVREAIPETDPLAKAEFNTLRERLIKIGARVIEHLARIRIHLPTSCPEHALFRVVALNLMPAVP